MLLGLSGGLGDADTIDSELFITGEGVGEGPLIARFVDAAIVKSNDLENVRAEVVATLGPDAAIDIAAIMADKHMTNRLADGTGTPLEGQFVEMSAPLRAALGFDELPTKRLEAPLS